jgi:hypothetical protein
VNNLPPDGLQSGPERIHGAPYGPLGDDPEGPILVVAWGLLRSRDDLGGDHVLIFADEGHEMGLQSI